MTTPLADPYADITRVDPAVVAKLADALELSARDPQHLAMLDSYLSELAPPPGARMLEVGCGTGAISRVVAARDARATVVGVDPSPALVARARELGADRRNLTFAVADGRELPFPEGSFDAALLHRVLSHLPEPDRVLAAAYRVVRPGGGLAVFDGDYSTITVAIGEHDPLQACIAAFIAAYTTDPWIVRRLPALVRAAGFTGPRLRTYGYVQVETPAYMLSIADRGVEVLAASGRIGRPLAAALQAEARRRAGEGAFHGHIVYASLVARRP